MNLRVLRDFRIGWRLLLKEPGYSAVVVLGLAVGFAACFLLLGYVAHSLSYDRHVPEREQVYRLMQKWNTASASGHWNDSTSLPARDGVVAKFAGNTGYAYSFYHGELGRLGSLKYPDGTTITVTVTDTYDPQFLGLIGINRLDVTGTATARLVRTLGGSEQ